MAENQPLETTEETIEMTGAAPETPAAPENTESTAGAENADTNTTEENTDSEAEVENPEDISYHAVEKDGSVTAIWEMHGQKHLRTISPRSQEGKQILALFETAA